MSNVLRSFTVTQFDDGYQVHTCDGDTGEVQPLCDVDGEYLFATMAFFIHSVYDSTRCSNA